MSSLKSLLRPKEVGGVSLRVLAVALIITELLVYAAVASADRGFVGAVGAMAACGGVGAVWWVVYQELGGDA